MIKRSTLVVTLMFMLTSVSRAQGFMPMLGVYLDSFTGLSGKGGVAYAFSSLANAEDTGFLVYTDVEFGSKASKVTLGSAYATGYTFSRVGVSYAKKDSQEYVGIEALHFVLLYSFKFGIYNDPYSDNKMVTAGFGIGF